MILLNMEIQRRDRCAGAKITVDISDFINSHHFAATRAICSNLASNSRAIVNTLNEMKFSQSINTALTMVSANEDCSRRKKLNF